MLQIPILEEFILRLGSTELSFIQKDNFILQVNDLVIWNRGKIGATYTEKKGQYEFKKKKYSH